MGYDGSSHVAYKMVKGQNENVNFMKAYLEKANNSRLSIGYPSTAITQFLIKLSSLIVASASVFCKPEMGLWTLLEGLLLLANALAILNEDRFLAPRGWSFAEFSVGQTKTLKGQLIGLIYAVQYMRVPLILLNSLSIIVKLVSG
ncbi:hypothetical protein Ancab_034276 [Ancistrocladus abbreviatus]